MISNPSADQQLPLLQASAGDNQRICLLLEYDGSGFYGSQFQSLHGEVLPTIQGTLQQAFDQLSITLASLMLASRTDAGTHAAGQVVRLTAPNGSLNNIPDLRSALNSVLPKTLRVKSLVSEVPAEFHCRNSATARWYRYVLYNRDVASPLTPIGSAWYPFPLDVDKMAVAAKLLLGAHNFNSFKCPDTTVQEDVCKILYTALFRENRHFIVFDIVANRFLYKMVRNIMGLLIAIGREDSPLQPSVILDLLSRQDRYATGQLGSTAKPEGLTLMAISYPNLYNFFSSDENVDTLIRFITQSNTTEPMQDENVFRKAS